VADDGFDSPCLARIKDDSDAVSLLKLPTTFLLGRLQAFRSTVGGDHVIVFLHSSCLMIALLEVCLQGR